MTKEEARREKARHMRYKRPMCDSINWYQILEDILEILDVCSDVQWMSSEEKMLINLLGDEDEAFEYRLAFSDLHAQAYLFYEELQDVQRYDFMSLDSDDEHATWFDLFFPACKVNDSMSGYDSFEEDYIRLDTYEAEAAQREARKRLKQLTKDQIIDLSGMALGIARNYMSLMYRYDCIKASIDILKGQNEGYLQMIKHIEDIYAKWNEESEGGKWKYTNVDAAFEKALSELPERLWVE